ncbi:MAG: ATP synthase F1 subunit gamma [Polyangiaceae bacterium]|nr:ATP synthase F1 subunit gamma [Polyangiaceae bacterium]
MANLKDIRRRIASVKSTQKITRAMKMVAGARLNRAQQRISAIRPYAVATGKVLAEVTNRSASDDDTSATDVDHPLLARRPEKSLLFVVITSDRGLCGAFNSSILRHAERLWHENEARGVKVQFAVIGRKGREYLSRRGAPILQVFEKVWDDLSLEQARNVGRVVLRPLVSGEVDAVYLVYNEFKSAMTQRVTAEALFPLAQDTSASPSAPDGHGEAPPELDFLFEPNKEALLERLVPMYVEITLLRALLESMASELGARMTAMDSATKNAADMIAKLTLKYNRARQAAITTELMEIIGGAEALNS